MRSALRGGSPTRRFARSVWRLLDTRAAVEEGIVPGGGVAYLRCLRNLDKLARTALQNAASVASLILTTIATIADPPKKKLPAAACRAGWTRWKT